MMKLGLVFVSVMIMLNTKRRKTMLAALIVVAELTIMFCGKTPEQMSAMIGISKNQLFAGMGIGFALAILLCFAQLMELKNEEES